MDIILGQTKTRRGSRATWKKQVQQYGHGQHGSKRYWAALMVVAPGRSKRTKAM